MENPELMDESEAIQMLTEEIFEEEKLPAKGLYEISTIKEKSEAEQNIWSEYLNFLRTTTVKNKFRDKEREMKISEFAREYFAGIKSGGGVTRLIYVSAWNTTQKLLRDYVKRKEVSDNLKNAGYKKKGFW